MDRDAPDYVQFYPTLRCNLTCSFCFNRGMPSLPDVAPGDFERIVSVLSARGVGEVDILGGEPTLHPRFGELMGILCAAEMRTTVSTNGRDVLLLAEVHEKCGKGLVRVGVSLNSGDIPPALHQYIVTHMPVCKSVYGRERKIPEAARQYASLAGLEYSLLFMDTVTRDDLGNSLPFHEFFRELELFRSRQGNVNGVFCSGFLPDSITHPALERVRCPAGTTKLSVLPDGSVYPCYLLFRYEEFRLGNVLVNDFDELWRNPRLDFFRRFEGNACPRSGCELFSRCHGGCPAVSLSVCGDLRAPDPRCVMPR